MEYIKAATTCLAWGNKFYWFKDCSEFLKIIYDRRSEKNESNNPSTEIYMRSVKFKPVS